MENNNSSGSGCLIFAGMFVGSLLVVLALCWNVPLHKTELGETVVVGDYVLGPLHDLRGLILGSPEAASLNGENSGQIAIIDERIFELLKPGVTTYALLRKHAGPGEHISSSSSGGVSTDEYLWRNPDGSQVVLIFQNGILASKIEHGLH